MLGRGHGAGRIVGSRWSSPLGGKHAWSSSWLAPRNKGVRYPADPPTVEEIVLVMRQTGDRPHVLRMRGLIVVMWRAGLRISETLALTESDLDEARGAILVRHGKGDKRREVGMDQWGFELLRPWLAYRVQIPVGALFCVIDGRNPRTGAHADERATTAPPHRAQRRGAASIRAASAAQAHAVEMAREGVPLNVIQRQLGHANLGITSVYLKGSTTPRSSTPSTPAERR